MSCRTVQFFVAFTLVVGLPTMAQAQWITFTDQTSSYLSLGGSLATSDPEEKDFGLGDLDKDGDLDLVNVRKDAFYGDVPKTHMLIMNVNGVMTDQTVTYAPGFLANPSLARVVLIEDFDGDTWLDIIVLNTNSQTIATNNQNQFYKNLGSSGCDWLGLQLEPTRLPTYNAPVGLFCSGAAGDIDNDGDIDVFLGDYNNNLEDRVLVNNGLGFFTDETATRLPGAASVFSAEANFADLDNDGDQDVVESNGTVGELRYHLNNGSGVFATGLIDSGGATYTSAIGDLNNDGKIDIYQGRDGQDRYSINNTPTGGALSFTHTTLSSLLNPKTTNFAGNAYLVDMDLDGDRDLVMGDTDVDVPGCTRRAVLYRNGFIGGGQTQLLVDPWGNPNLNLNIHTQGTHDIAVLDLNSDGLPDMIYGRCTGYNVFIQNGSPFKMKVSEPAAGGLTLTVNHGVPNAPGYTLVSTVQVFPVGSGSFFGLDPSAFQNFVDLSPIGEPIVYNTDGAGAYSFSLPAGSLPCPFPTQWRGVQLPTPSTFSLTSITTITF